MKAAALPRILCALLLLAGVALLSGPALAQTSPGHDLSWHVVAGGGLRAASSTRVVQSTVGQFAIGPVGGTHALGSGYWYGVRPAGCTIYLPLVPRGYQP